MTARRSCRPGRAIEGGVDRPDPVVAPWRRASASGSRLRTELPLVRRWRRTRGSRSPAPATRRSEVALAPAPGPAGLAPSLAVRRRRRGTTLVARRATVGGVEREGRAGALGDLLLDLAAERRAVERAEPGLLAEDVLGAASWPGRRPRSRRPAAANSARVRAWASTVAAMAPAEVAVTMSGTMPSTPTRYCSAPTSKDPLVPPPARTNAVGPVRGVRASRRFWHRARRRGPQRRSPARGGAHHLDQGAGPGRRRWPTPSVGRRSGRRPRPRPSGRRPR